MAEVLAVRDEYRAQQWAMLIQESKSSGLTNKDFCIQRGVSEKSFYYWQKKLRTKLVKAAAPQLVQLEADSAPAERECKIKCVSGERGVSVKPNQTHQRQDPYSGPCRASLISG